MNCNKDIFVVNVDKVSLIGTKYIEIDRVFFSGKSVNIDINLDNFLRTTDTIEYLIKIHDVEENLLKSNLVIKDDNIKLSIRDAKLVSYENRIATFSVSNIISMPILK